MRRAYLPVRLAMLSLPAISAAPVSADKSHPPTVSVTTLALEDGSLVDQVVINGPPNPPPGVERASVPLPASGAATGANILVVPAYRWSFGCSATSVAMIAARQDLDGRTTLGSMDDYWEYYLSAAKDPYITGHWA